MNIKLHNTHRNSGCAGGRLAWLARGLAMVIVAIGLSACGSDEDVYFEQPVEDLYNEAMDLMLIGEYGPAAQGFDEVERQHPYSIWATKAQLMSAYAYYQASEYDESILSARRFIELHPGSVDVAYAYYLIALSYYEQISDVGRDQMMTELAFQSLEEVVRRFPDSKYARDAKLKIDLTTDHLAGKEMEIGRYYQTRGEYAAAINRFRSVVDNFQTTTHIPEALHRLVESFLVLGVVDEARTTAAVLGYNYPGSEWYADSYALLSDDTLRTPEEQESWFVEAWDWVF